MFKRRFGTLREENICGRKFCGIKECKFEVFFWSGKTFFLIFKSGFPLIKSEINALYFIELNNDLLLWFKNIWMHIHAFFL